MVATVIGSMAGALVAFAAVKGASGPLELRDPQRVTAQPLRIADADTGAVLSLFSSPGEPRGDGAAARFDGWSAAQPIPWPPSILGTAGPESHDPEVLYTRAASLQKAGLDITVERRLLSESALEGAVRATAIRPVERHGNVVGFVLYNLPYDSPLRHVGVRNGDLITAVNGHPLTSPERVRQAHDFVRDDRVALFELVRNERRVVVLLRLV